MKTSRFTRSIKLPASTALNVAGASLLLAMTLAACDPIASTAVKVSSISITADKASITGRGGTIQLTATVQPADAANPAVVWSLAPASGLADVSAGAVLSAAGNGTVTVKATAKDGSGVSASRSFSIAGQSAAAPATGGLANAKRNAIMAYLDGQFSHAILSGQQNLTWAQSIDMVARVFTTTGKYPAIQGFDFMDYLNKAGQHANADNQTSLAQAWWIDARGTGRHGIVTFCWHWRDPSRATDNFYAANQSSPVGPGMHIPLDANGLFDPTTAIGLQMKNDLDFVAGELAKLCDAGVPVLWRPLHEGGGNAGNTATSGPGAWFWWGQDGSKAYIALYRWMYTYFSVTKGLDNLIWVWNGQDATYYPGDAYVDVGGWDTYGDLSHGSQKSRYSSLRGITGNKLAALTEVGPIPTVANLQADGAWFSWFMVWNDGSGSVAADNFWSGGYWNTAADEQAIYASSYVITLDELPLF